MTTISGVVEATNQKDIRTKFGVRVKTGLKIGETWYNLLDKQAPNVGQGDTVSFEATDGKFGWDIDGKTIKVSQGAAPAKTADGRQPVAQGSVTHTEKQIRVSHGINVAAQILGSLEPTATEEDERAYFKALDEWARRIVRLAQNLVANYEAVAGGKAPKAVAPAAAPTPPPPPPPPPAPAAAEVAFDDETPF